MFLMDQPVTTGCLILLLIAFSMNYTMKDTSNKLGLVTVNTLVADTQIWNLLTSQFYEAKMIKLAFDVIGLIIISRSLKLRLGKQTIMFLTSSILSCSLFTSVYCFIRYFSTGIEEMIMAPIFGFSGVFIIIATYARQQLRGQSVIQNFPNITYNNLPVLVITAQFLLWLVGLKVFAVDLPFSIIGLLFSWSYLRFFYYYDEKIDVNGISLGRILGDKSDEFAFVAMFPEALHLIIIPMSTSFYNIFAMMGIFPEIESVLVEKSRNHHLRYGDCQNPRSMSTLKILDSGPGSEEPLSSPRSRVDEVQERRRAKAIKLLDAKMAEMTEESIINV